MTVSRSHHIVSDARPALSGSPRDGPNPGSWPVGGDRYRCAVGAPAARPLMSRSALTPRPGIPGWFPMTSGRRLRRDDRTVSGHTEIRRKKRPPVDAPSGDESRG
jgi:hypothetical protein